MRLKAIVLAILASACSHLAEQSANALDVRFYPNSLHPYELDEAHKASSLLVHNIAIINDGAGPVTVTNVEIELLSGEGRLGREIGGKGAALECGEGGQRQGAAQQRGIQRGFHGDLLQGSGPPMIPLPGVSWPGAMVDQESRMGTRRQPPEG